MLEAVQKLLLFRSFGNPTAKSSKKSCQRCRPVPPEKHRGNPVQGHSWAGDSPKEKPTRESNPPNASIHCPAAHADDGELCPNAPRSCCSPAEPAPGPGGGRRSAAVAPTEAPPAEPEPAPPVAEAPPPAEPEPAPPAVEAKAAEAAAAAPPTSPKSRRLLWAPLPSAPRPGPVSRSVKATIAWASRPLRSSTLPEIASRKAIKRCFALACRWRVPTSSSGRQPRRHGAVHTASQRQLGHLWSGGTIGEAALGIYEGYFSSRANASGLKGGRFAMNYGEALVIGNLDWHQSARAFDGVHAKYKMNKGYVDAFATQTGSGFGTVTDPFAGDTYFWGLYSGWAATSKRDWTSTFTFSASRSLPPRTLRAPTLPPARPSPISATAPR